MVDGILTPLGDKKYLIPALNFKRLRALKPELQALADNEAGADQMAQFDVCVKIIHSAITRNYPELTEEDLEDLIDLQNMPNVMQIVMGQSGLVPTSGE